jgi:hypothetical protein
MSEIKKYWHEAPKDEIDALYKAKITYGELKERYEQPEWCAYMGALDGKFGCYSLMSEETRMKISRKYCKYCDCYETIRQRKEHQGVSR